MVYERLRTRFIRWNVLVRFRDSDNRLLFAKNDMMPGVLRRLGTIGHTFAIGLGCMLASPLSATVTLQISDVTLQEGKVEFRAGVCDSTLASPNASQQAPQSSTANYTLVADVGNATHGSYGYFIYPLYLRRNADNKTVCGYRVQVIPSGTFLDQMADAHFQVGDGAQVEQGTIRVPLYNLVYSKAMLQSGGSAKPAVVSLSGVSTLEFTLTNGLADLPIGLYPDPSVSPGHLSYWSATPKAELHLPRSGSTLLNPGQTIDGAISVTLRSNAWHALGASIFPLAPDQPHETMTLYVNYDTPGGIPSTLEIPIAIRFRPSFWSLILAVLVGAIIGSMLAQLIKKKDAESLAWYKAFGVALLGSALAEVLGIVLVYGGSEFRLLGFELDPYQLLPVVAIGGLVGLVGFRNADDFLKLIPATKKP